MRVLVAPDKFKGSLSAAEVARCLVLGLSASGAECRALPLADGGDGSVEAAVAAGFEAVPVTVAGATGTPRQAPIPHCRIMSETDDRPRGLPPLPGSMPIIARAITRRANAPSPIRHPADDRSKSAILHPVCPH